MRRVASYALVAALLMPPSTLGAEQPPAAPREPAPDGSMPGSPGSLEPPPAQPPPAATAKDGEEPDWSRPPVFYETTTVTARPVSSASGSVTVLDARELEASAARSAGDVVRQVPGLNALSSGGRAGVTHAFIRGSDPNYTLVLLDGIPLNDSTERQGGAVNLEELPAGLVERAEIVRGPLTSFYGTSGLAGVIQLFTPRGGPGGVRARLGAEAGNADLRRAFARASGPAGRGGWAAGASWDEERHRIAKDRFRQVDAWANADIAFGSATALGLTARVAAGEADDYPDASGGPEYGTGLLRHTEHEDFSLGARLELGEPHGRRHRLSAGLARRVQDRESPPVPPVVPASEEQTSFTRLRLAWQVPLRRTAASEIDAGFSGEGEWGDNTSLLRLPAPPGGEVAGDFEKARATGGVYGGVRHQRGPLLAEATLRLDLATGDSLQANPHLGLVWRPRGGGTRVRTSIGRASKLPSFFALASPPALGGNPALEPEHVWGGEAGVERSFRGARLDLGVTYFRQEYSNLVDFDFDRFLHVNRSRVRTQGVELLARWQPHASLLLEAEATYLDVSVRGGGELLHTPRWTGGGQLTWQPTGRLSLRLQTRGTSRYLDRQYPVPERDSVDGYGLVGVAGWWRLARGFSVRARLDNLTDRAYETYIGFPGPRRSFWTGLGWDRR